MPSGLFPNYKPGAAETVEALAQVAEQRAFSFSSYFEDCRDALTSHDQGWSLPVVNRRNDQAQQDILGEISCRSRGVWIRDDALVC